MLHLPGFAILDTRLSEEDAERYTESQLILSAVVRPTYVVSGSREKM